MDRPLNTKNTKSHEGFQSTAIDPTCLNWTSSPLLMSCDESKRRCSAFVVLRDLCVSNSSAEVSVSTREEPRVRSLPPATIFDSRLTSTASDPGPRPRRILVASACTSRSRRRRTFEVGVVAGVGEPVVDAERDAAKDDLGLGQLEERCVDLEARPALGSGDGRQIGEGRKSGSRKSGRQSGYPE